MTEPSSELAARNSSAHFRSLRAVMALAIVTSLSLASTCALLYESITSYEAGELLAAALMVILIANSAFSLGWLLFGDDHWIVRFTMTFCSLGNIVVSLSIIEPTYRATYTSFVVLVLATLLIPLCCLRIAGFRCRNGDASEERTRVRQFTIRELLIATTFVAGVLGIGRLLQFSIPEDLKEAMIVVCIVALIVAFAWTCGFSYYPIVSGGLIAIVSATISFGVLLIQSSILLIFLFSTATGWLLLAQIVMLRMHGYRFGRKSA